MRDLPDRIEIQFQAYDEMNQPTHEAGLTMQHPSRAELPSCEYIRIFLPVMGHQFELFEALLHQGAQCSGDCGSARIIEAV